MPSRKSFFPNPEMMTQWKPWMVTPPQTAAPAVRGRPAGANIRLSLSGKDLNMRSNPDVVKSLIIQMMLRKLAGGITPAPGFPNEPMPYRPGLPGAPVPAHGGMPYPEPPIGPGEPYRPGLPGAPIPAA